MIKGVHTMFYSSEPEALRAFLRDVIGFKATDIGGGWLIFELPEANMGVHPADAGTEGASGNPDISFYCDDIEQTVRELQEKGVTFHEDGIQDHGYGFVTFFRAPGNFYIQLYQPKYG